jgi:hypothetical protein
MKLLLLCRLFLTQQKIWKHNSVQLWPWENINYDKTIQLIATVENQLLNLTKIFAENEAKVENQYLNLTKIISENEFRNDKRQVEADKRQAKIDKQLSQLIGYNQNQDKNLEFNLGVTMKNFLINNLSIPEEAVFEYYEKKLYNTTNGITAVEWDGIFLIDYARTYNLSSVNNIIEQNTLLLIETKQNVNITEVLQSLQKRINTTLLTINSKFLPSADRRNYIFNNLIMNQKAFFIENPSIIVAIGSRNMNSTVQKIITDSGYIAIAPSGNDFKVVLPGIFCQ